MLQQPFTSQPCQLFQNFRNPFNPVTSIYYALPETGQVALKVGNISGQEICTLGSLINKMQYYLNNYESALKTANYANFRRLEFNKINSR
jgi:hypothetical protein